jgi:hypothetical protein
MFYYALFYLHYPYFINRHDGIVLILYILLRVVYLLFTRHHQEANRGSECRRYYQNRWSWQAKNEKPLIIFWF